MNKKVWLLLYCFIIIDELSTFIAVNFLGYFEYNAIARYLIYINDYATLLMLDMIIMPLCVYGMFCFYSYLFKDDKIGLRLRDWIVYGVLIGFVPALINNIYLILLKLV